MTVSRREFAERERTFLAGKAYARAADVIIDRPDDTRDRISQRKE